MLTQTLAYIHYGSVMLFGIMISAFFLGVKQNKANILRLSAFFVVVGSVYVVCVMNLGADLTMKLYPLIIHMPLILFLFLFYKYSFLSSCVSVFTAYLCCQVSNWLGLLVLVLSGNHEAYFAVRILTTAVVFYFLCKYVSHTTSVVFAKNRRELIIIGVLPFVYYVFDYITTKYSELLYSSNRAVAEFMSFAFCIAYLVFLLVYFHEYEKKQELKRYGDMMQMQLLSMEKEIAQVKASKKALTIMRHDMRHHLNAILTQLQNGNEEAAIEYIRQIGGAYSDTEVTTYCSSEMLNAVLSIWHSRFEECGVPFECEVAVDSVLLCPELAVCTILSNALENAMNALLEEDAPEQKEVRLRIFQKNGRLMIQMENTCGRTPRFVDGMPLSREKGHGIGTRSMVYYVEQLNGQCQFLVEDRKFKLRIII